MELMLFTTPTCQFCGPAKEILAEVPGVQTINAMENMELAREFGIRSVPTLIVKKCSGVHTFTGLEEIRDYASALKGSVGCGCNCGH